MKVYVPVLAILSLVFLNYTALSNGIDGTSLIVTSGLISGLGGYYAKDIVPRVLASLKEPEPAKKTTKGQKTAKK